VNYVILLKAKPYTRTRRGKLERVRGYTGKQRQAMQLDRLIQNGFKKSERKYYRKGWCGVFALALHDFLKSRGLKPKIYLIGESSKVRGNTVKKIMPEKLSPSYFGHAVVSLGNFFYDVDGIHKGDHKSMKELAEKYSDFDISSNVFVRVDRESILRNMGVWKSLQSFREKDYRKVQEKLGAKSEIQLDSILRKYLKKFDRENKKEFPYA